MHNRPADLTEFENLVLRANRFDEVLAQLERLAKLVIRGDAALLAKVDADTNEIAAQIKEALAGMPPEQMKLFEAQVVRLEEMGKPDHSAPTTGA